MQLWTINCNLRRLISILISSGIVGSFLANFLISNSGIYRPPPVLYYYTIIQDHCQWLFSTNIRGNSFCNVIIQDVYKRQVLAFLYNTFEALFSVVAYESGYSFKQNESGVNFWAVKNAEIFSFKWQIAEVRGVMAVSYTHLFVIFVILLYFLMAIWFILNVKLFMVKVLILKI